MERRLPQSYPSQRWSELFQAESVEKRSESQTPSFATLHLQHWLWAAAGCPFLGPPGKKLGSPPAKTRRKTDPSRGAVGVPREAESIPVAVGCREREEGREGRFEGCCLAWRAASLAGCCR